MVKLQKKLQITHVFYRNIMWLTPPPLTSHTSSCLGRVAELGPFVGGKNGHESFRQARIYNFCDKCVVFARNRKFANLTQ